MRYVWDMRSDYLGTDRQGPIARAIAGLAAHYLRNWDVVSATRVDQFIANSNHVKNRIWKYYRRTSEVVFPPVDLDQYRISSRTGDYFLTVSALVPYKRVDLAIETCTRLGVRLVVVGDGSERQKLQRLAKGKVEFVGWQSQEQLLELYQNAIALLFPGEEDFGITPVEAQACGTPVIAYGQGGVLDTVVADGEHPTGTFFYTQTPEAIMELIRKFDPSRFDPVRVRDNALQFGRPRFRQEVIEVINRAWETTRFPE